MRVLLHACCGPCSLYPIEVLREQGVDFALFYANPNIHPFKEWKERKKTFVAVAESAGVKYWVDKDYPLEDFLREQLCQEDRCEYCYVRRLTLAAEKAVAEGYDAFSTTLLVSPYQNHDLIRDIGRRLAEVYEIEFFYHDFRPGFTWAQDKAVADGLYRQKYCGCIFSERDRYRKKAKNKQKAVVK